jgi:hypothetical protein
MDDYGASRPRRPPLLQITTFSAKNMRRFYRLDVQPDLFGQ